MDKKILVTGATGNVGFEVAQGLQQQGVPFMAAGRHEDKARSMLGEDISFVKFDFADPSTHGPALKDVDKIFLMRPPAVADAKKYIQPFIDMAAQRGIKHIVFLSIMGAESNPVVPHRTMEKQILASRIPYTFLRASFFMQNLNTTHQPDIKNNNRIFVPAGHGRTSFIDVRDIAAVGVLAFLNSIHRNEAYDLTGDKALDYYEVAEDFTKVLGRKITYTNPGLIQFWKGMREQGYDQTFIGAMIGVYTTARLGLAKRVTNDTEMVLNRPPISVKQYVADYQDYWKL